MNAADEIVGVLFAVTVGDPGALEVGWGTATPIVAILDKFRMADGINLAVATATTPGDVRRVPAQSPAAPKAPEAVPAFVHRLREDLDQTESGRALVDAWLRHNQELFALMTTNKRATVRWRQAGGPVLLHHLMRSLQSPSRPLPVSVDGHPWDEKVDEVFDIIFRYGSPELKRAMAAQRAWLPAMAGRRYEEILSDIHRRAASDRNAASA